MNSDNKLDELTKHERQFLSENDGEMNEHGVFLYKSDNENHLLSLDFFLLSYKTWLIENGIVKEA